MVNRSKTRVERMSPRHWSAIGYHESEVHEREGLQAGRCNQEGLQWSY